MKFAALTFVASLALGAHAHFRLLFPEPRGPFVADREPLFCGGYDNATSNRTDFPLEGGFFRIRQGHEDWTGGVLISTAVNPSSFADFADPANASAPLLARNWATEAKTGNFCIPLDLSSTGIAGLGDGVNVTIQVALSGGDGQLYQCADLTLRAGFTLPADVTAACVNQTVTPTGGHGSHGASSTAPAASSTAGAGSSAGYKLEHMSILGSVAVGAIGAVVAMVL